MQLIAKELGSNFQGLMCYNLREACWLAKEYKFNDILMGYPIAEKSTLTNFYDTCQSAKANGTCAQANYLNSLNSKTRSKT